MNIVKGALRVGIIMGAVGGGGYWLWRYLRPEHSSLTLNESVVIITGASSGIGRALARSFAKRGARLVLVARRVELLEAVCAEVAPYASDVLIVPADITDDKQLEQVVEKTLAAYGRIDMLINNAGVHLHGPLQRDSVAELRHMINVNLSSAVALTRLALPTMLAQRSGQLVFIASLASVIYSPFQPGYAATKAGLLAFSRAMRRQLDGTGIGLTLVMPGFTATDMVPPRMAEAAQQLGMETKTPEYVAEKTLDGILKGQREISFSTPLLDIGGLLEKLSPALSDLFYRLIMTPERVAGTDRHAE